MKNLIHLVPDKPRALSIGDARDGAKSAYSRARKAQRELAANLILTTLLHREGAVSYGRLRGERNEAQRQVDRARAVFDALDEAVRSLEDARRDA